MEQRISIERLEQAVNIFGSFDENIRLLEQEFSVTVVNREGELRVEGEPENTVLACKSIQALLTLSSRGEAIGEQNVRYVINMVRAGKEEKIAELTGDVLCISAKGRPIKPKTVGQKDYIASVLKNTVTIGVGPAGTGKTYLAVAAAVMAFRDKQVNRIILTRPAVEAGERLGFLPGDLQSKVDPYLRPLYDALFDMLGAETYQKYLERGNIEVAPLAYMRGRTLDDSFIILDEAQNTSREQMKMFLTRLGFGSKIVITGDATQIDLPDGKTSGLKEAMRVLRNVEGIGICELTNADVVRHVMVQRIVQAYEDYEHRKDRRDRDKGKWEMSWDVYLLKTPTNREKDLSEVTEAAPMPCWRELRQMLRCRFPDLISGYAQLESGIQFPVLSSPDYLLEFNLAVDSEEEPLTGIMFHRPGCGERWAYPLKFLCDLLDARIIDCGGGEFWDWDHLPGWIAKGL